MKPFHSYIARNRHELGCMEDCETTHASTQRLCLPFDVSDRGLHVHSPLTDSTEGCKLQSFITKAPKHVLLPTAVPLPASMLMLHMI